MLEKLSLLSPKKWKKSKSNSKKSLDSARDHGKKFLGRCKQYSISSDTKYELPGFV